MLGMKVINKYKVAPKYSLAYLIGITILSLLYFSTLYFFRISYAEKAHTELTQTGLLYHIGIVCFLFLIPIALHNYTKKQEVQTLYEKLKAENAISKYNALKNQLDPHFLFNTISILDSLIDEDKDKAHNYLEHFSTVYRYMLQTKNEVSLAEELAFVEAYIGLLTIRYGKGLQIEKKLSSSFLAQRIIPFSIQTLIENAVKHNKISEQSPLKIRIETKNKQLIVCNNLQPKGFQTAGTKVGLSNISELYKLRWNTDISIEQNVNFFCVSIPLIQLEK